MTIQPTDGQMDGWTKQGVESCSTQQKMIGQEFGDSTDKKLYEIRD